MTAKTFKTTIARIGSMCFIPVPFDPKTEFGKARVPVEVTLKGFTYRSTIVSMGGAPCVAFCKAHQEATGVGAEETVQVRLALDTRKREVTPPADFVKALKAQPPAWERWRALSFTHQREHVEAIAEAKKPETRTRRIERAVAALAAMPERRPRGKSGK